MTYRIVCDDSNQELWKAERNRLFTASDIGTLLGMQPDFFDTTLDDILEEKSLGKDRDFTADRIAAIEHGRLTEAANMQKASALFGIPVAPFHYLVKNDRWPHLGATLDGLGIVRCLTEPNFRLAKQHGPGRKARYETHTHVRQVRDGLEALQRQGIETLIVEMKNTESHMYKRKGETQAWIEDVPTYNVPQVQTQMHIMGIDHCLICAQLGANNMTGFLVYRDPEWVDLLDRAQNKAAELLNGAPPQEVRIDL